MHKSSIACLPALVASLCVLSACGDRSAPPAAPPDGSYTVRGEIVQLPRAGGREIMIRHEAVPDLRDASGKVVGMESMTMSFPLAPDVDPAALAVGERISFTLEVRWNAADAVLVRNVVPLPAGTRLAFDPPADSPP